VWDADLGHYVDPLYEQWAAEARARYRNAARGSPGETESPWWAGTKAGLYAFFVSGPRNLGVGAFNAGREAVYYVRDVGAVGADAVVTGTGALVGKSWSLGVEEWSQVGRNNQPSNPNFWSDALTNAGRAGLAAGTLGTSEIAFGTYQYAKTGDADAFQQQMGGIAAGNLAGAATIKTGQTIRTTARSNAPGAARAPGTFAEQMTPAEAARYQQYWQRHAPQQVQPGTGRLDFLRQSGRTGRMESSRVIYDEFGRQRYRVDLSDHMRPEVHSNPHLHEYQYGPGFSNAGRESVFNFGQ